MNTNSGNKENDLLIRQLVENWALAVRNKDMETILAHHADDVVMFDVPKPFKSEGIEAYRKTWNLFFVNTKPGVFDIQELHIVTDERVAFCYATMKCADKSSSEDFIELDFRLTIGFKKINNQWIIVHEHHSMPAD